MIHFRWEVQQSSWVLLGSGISADEKKVLHQLQEASGASVVSEWSNSVTHVICGMSETGKAK